VSWQSFSDKFEKEIVMTISDQIDRINNTGASEERAKVVAQKAHGEVFRDPHEYMSILNENFSKLSHGHQTLTLNDLKIDSEDQSLDPKVRAAAQIAQSHYGELMAIGDQSQDTVINRERKSTVLSKDGVRFGLDMVNHDVFGPALGSFVNDTTVGGMTAIGGIIAGASGLSMATEGGAGLAATLGVGAGLALTGVGVVTIGAGAYMWYEGVSAYLRYSNLANDDRSEISNWL